MLDERARTADDLALLERLRLALRSVPHADGEQRVRRDGEVHRIVVPDWQALLSARPVSAVGFFGQARADVDHDPILVLEDEIVGRAASFDGLLAYHNALLEPGRWANLVLFSDALAIGSLRHDGVHEAAVALTPAHYASVRLHRGILADGALGARPFERERTLCLDFSCKQPRRWISTPGAKESTARPRI